MRIQYRRAVNVFLIMVTGVVMLHGRISIKGNVPHTYTVLTSDSGKEYRIVGDKVRQLSANYQSKTVTVRGKVVKEAVGPGFPAEFDVSEVIGSE